MAQLISKTTNLTPFSMVYLVILLVLAMTLRRELVLLPFLLVTLFMTIGQQIIVAGLSMTVLRITLVFIWVRVLARGEHKRIQPSLLDNWLVGWLLIRTVVNIILWRAQGSVIIGNLGHVYDALGIYFLFRIMITNNEELRRIVIFVCALSIPLCAMVLVEHFTGHNPFAVFGGVPETVVMRDGRARCQGPFRHAILAGTFGATTMPFAVGLVRDWDLRVRRIGIVSVASNLVIVFLSASSGPILATLAVAAALLLWPLRAHMRMVRRTMLIGLLALQLLMKAPIWYLFARMSDLLGMGGGWYRSALIDAAVGHFAEWGLMGAVYTAHWMPFQLTPNMADITNQYIGEGVDGGAISMVLFIGILVSAYRHVGIGGASARLVGFLRLEVLAWVVGASLTAHAVSYLGIGYFDQMIVFWFLILSVAATLGAFRGDGVPVVADEGRVLLTRRGRFQISKW